MNALAHIRSTERPALIASLRRYVAGEASRTADERRSDQIANVRGLVEWSHEQQRWLPSALGRLWLDAVEVFGGDVEIQLSEEGASL